ncbi:hypothetical protein ABZ438_10270 [Streptomyces sp. NPDC005786]|uniref:hypothetical protein n=1 Tax=Streptomyces sp. NPDC005786 TaxID=3154891 RepID=UPI0033D274B4
MSKPPVVGCVQAPAPRRLHAPGAVVIIVTLAAVLTFLGVPAIEILQLLAGASLVAGATIALVRTGLLQAVRPAVRALVAAPSSTA